MSCLETYATLRIFSDSVDPETVGHALGFTGTDIRKIDPESKYRHERESHYWGWCSKPTVQSIDNLEHVSAITQRLAGKANVLAALRARGCEIDICCYWVTSGQGGPELDVAALKRLSELEIGIWWDVYFGTEAEYADDVAAPTGAAST